jgi:hypothetical protein
MKKLLSILFIAIATMAQAQDTKPTKEETQRFLNSMLSKTIGEIRYEIQPIKTQIFSENFSKYEITYSLEDDNSYFNTDVITLIKWDNFLVFNTYSEEVYDNQNLAQIMVVFSTNIKNVNTCEICKEKTTYSKQFGFLVLKDKIESAKKAIIRLAEIAKEENKDPFGN